MIRIGGFTSLIFCGVFTIMIIGLGFYVLNDSLEITWDNVQVEELNNKINSRMVSSNLSYQKLNKSELESMIISGCSNIEFKKSNITNCIAYEYSKYKEELNKGD